MANEEGVVVNIGMRGVGMLQLTMMRLSASFSLKMSVPNAADLMPGPTADIMRTTQNDRGYEDVMTFKNVPI